MEQLKVFKCPNCGASTSNTQNCEYCGSLLVRFAEKGIDISNTSYINNSEVIPGLIKELEKNLELQNEDNPIFVSTDIFWKTKDGDQLALGILDSIQDNVYFDNTPIGLKTKSKGLIVVFSFNTYVDNRFSEFNQRVDAQLVKFKQLTSFPLFTAHYGSFDDRGLKRLERSYAIHFGQDVEGAARLISEVMTKVMGYSPTDNCDIFTNAGVDAVINVRNVWLEAHGFSVSNSVSNDNAGCLSGIFVLLILLLGLFM